KDWITGFYRFFSSVCILTSFLGVSLCVFDFLADGLKLKKKGRQGVGVLAATFIPPTMVVLFYPGIFISALGYAGAAIVLLILLKNISFIF
ncbi:MAG: tryptophan/tyrosine permease, partial [Candidatus Heimdallarchaeota archaeon]|nr:tryptophan/tyrosine permease [Candidatus Heimdallarchaeota archaeon]